MLTAVKQYPSYQTHNATLPLRTAAYYNIRTLYHMLWISVLRSWWWAKSCPKYIELILEINKCVIVASSWSFYIIYPSKLYLLSSLSVCIDCFCYRLLLIETVVMWKEQIHHKRTCVFMWTVVAFDQCKKICIFSTYFIKPHKKFKKNCLDIGEFFLAEERTDKTKLIVVFAT
jgi:hypothetical protein